jgi:GNAT superfamily N-acetyltransferase
VGRGGLEVALTVLERLDPAAKDVADAVWCPEEAAPGSRPLAVIARREHGIAGVAEGWSGGGVAFLARLVVAAPARGEGVGSRLLAAFESEAVDRGCPRLGSLAAAGGEGDRFLRGRGWVEECRLNRWYGDQDYVRLRRDR